MKKNPDESLWALFGLYSALGFQLVLAVVLCGLGGYWLDKRLLSDPWMTLIGLLLGSIAGFYGFFKVLKKQNEE